MFDNLRDFFKPVEIDEAAERRKDRAFLWSFAVPVLIVGGWPIIRLLF